MATQLYGPDLVSVEHLRDPALWHGVQFGKAATNLAKLQDKALAGYAKPLSYLQGVGIDIGIGSS